MESEYARSPRLRLVTVVQDARVAEGVAIKTPHTASRQVREMLAGKDREHFVALHLDGRHRVVSAEVVSVGTLTTSLVHPREVFKGAMLANSAAVICAHNHPSGDVKPSEEDRQVFDRLKEAGELLGIPLLDFLIVSEADMWSASEHWT